MTEKDLVNDYQDDLFWKSIIKKMNFKNFRLPTIDEESLDDNVKNYINHNTHYQLNEHGFRSDGFIKNHDGLHVLFAGCSCTLGTGNDLQDVWAYQLYNELKKSNKVSGYYNLGQKGGSFISIMHSILLYIDLYGNPDVIFLLLPSTERDEKYFSDTKYTNDFIITLLYKMFELFCESKNIKLISSSWVIDDSEVGLLKSIQNKLSNKMYRRRFDSDIEESHGLKILENNSKTFKMMNLKNIDSLMFNYIQNNSEKENLYEAKDPGRHYGSAFHYAWMKEMLGRYKETNNEKNN